MENLTVIVPYRNDPNGVRRLLSSLPSEVPVIVVDDGSDPPLRLRRKGVTVLRLEERGYFSGAVNAGISACDTDVLVLNQDVTLSSDWPAQLESFRVGYAMIGDGVMAHPAWPQGYVQGTCMFMRRDAIQQVGLLDATHWPLWGATAEWQLRVCRAGFEVLPLHGLDWIEHARGDKPYGASIEALLREQSQRRDLFIRTPPLISVVTACYNYGRYLPDLLASLLGGATSLGQHPGQTFQGFEVVIVDDRSTDDSWERIRALASDWRGVRGLRRSVNGGSAVAMNTGIKHAYGRYIMAIDADDMLEPHALEVLLEGIERDPKRLYYSDQRLFADGKRGELWKTRDYDFDALLERNHVPAGAMFAKAAWKAAGGYPATFGRGRQDWAFAVAMGAAGFCGQRVPEPLYLYRREGQNRSLTNTTPAHRADFAEQMRRTFPRLYKGERPMGCCGGRGARLIKQAQKIAPTLLAGADGMVLLGYVGPNSGRQYFYGPITKTRYTVKGTRRQVYVDKLDAALMLDMVADHQHVFKLAAATEPTPEEVETVTSDEVESA